MNNERIAQAIVALLAERDPASSICPSEVARALEREDGAWRALMPRVRQVAAGLAADGVLIVTRGEEQVDALSPGGPIRLRRAGRRP